MRALFLSVGETKEVGQIDMILLLAFLQTSTVYILLRMHSQIRQLGLSDQVRQVASYRYCTVARKLSCEFGLI